MHGYECMCDRCTSLESQARRRAVDQEYNDKWDKVLDRELRERHENQPRPDAYRDRARRR